MVAFRGTMHYLGLEILETRKLEPAIPDLIGLATPAADLVFLCSPRGLHRGGEPVALPPGFGPKLLVECPEREILVIDARGDSIALGHDGAIRRRFSLGEGIADAATDEFGIFVLRTSGRLEKFAFDGKPLPDDPQVKRINATSQGREGVMLLVPYDGSVWLNLEEHFDEAGEPTFRLDAAGILGEGMVAADLLGDDAIVALAESGRIFAIDVRGSACEARFDREILRARLGREFNAARDCLATRGDLLTVLSTDVGALTTCRTFME